MAYSITSIVVDFIRQVDIDESASGPPVSDMRIVTLGAVTEQPPLIPSRERQWIANHRIALQTFNEVLMWKS